eukprot:12929699-Prorocentrum_lima.AAC.1
MGFYGAIEAIDADEFMGNTEFVSNTEWLRCGGEGSQELKEVVTLVGSRKRRHRTDGTAHWGHDKWAGHWWC